MENLTFSEITLAVAVSCVFVLSIACLIVVMTEKAKPTSVEDGQPQDPPFNRWDGVDRIKHIVDRLSEPHTGYLLFTAHADDQLRISMNGGWVAVGMAGEDMRDMAKELNAATAPVRQKYLDRHRAELAETLLAEFGEVRDTMGKELPEFLEKQP
jgi:hypothetical protein